MKNEYEVRGEVTAIIIKHPDGSVIQTMISSSDFDKVNSFPNSWYVVMYNNNPYIYGHYVGRKGKVVALHRLIYDNPKGYEIDHINHNTLDNTRNNLRVVTRAQNSQNLNGAHKDSKSGIRGVYWQKNLNKWQAQICINRERIHLGTFTDKAEAEKTVIEARQKYMPFSKDYRQKQKDA
jgi:hypothetical protein